MKKLSDGLRTVLVVLSFFPLINIASLLILALHSNKTLHIAAAVAYILAAVFLYPGFVFFLWLVPFTHFWCILPYANFFAVQPIPAVRVLSFVPGGSLGALVFLGRFHKKPVSILLGALYATIFFLSQKLFFLFCWLIPCLHFWISFCVFAIQKKQEYKAALRRYNTKNTISETALPAQKTVVHAAQPNRKAVEKPVATATYIDFFKDMRECEALTAPPCPPALFQSQAPTYDKMDLSQKKWYFFWRSQTRAKQYPPTDLPYILLNSYELLSGIGWKKPEDGLEMLLDLWQNYRENHPQLDKKLGKWCADFILEHHLPYRTIPGIQPYAGLSGTQLDLFLQQHASSVPLKLPFPLIDQLCDYPIQKSKFYAETAKDLMEEAIPRAISLADAAMRKQGHADGLFSLAQPDDAPDRSYALYQGALTPKAGYLLLKSPKIYSASPALRGYVQQLVRHSENVLRGILGVRSRLPVKDLDHALALLITKFLQKEYGKKPEQPPKQLPPAPIKLNMSSLSLLREASDHVREILSTERTVPNKLLMVSDPDTIRNFCISLSSDESDFLQEVCSKEPQAQNALSLHAVSINRQSHFYFGSELVSASDGSVLVSEEIKTEMLQCLALRKNAASVASAGKEDDKMRTLLSQLGEAEKEALRILLSSPQPQADLFALADKHFSMPDLLVDGINQTALPLLGDILVDTTGEIPTIVEEYLPALTNTI